MSSVDRATGGSQILKKIYDREDYNSYNVRRYAFDEASEGSEEGPHQNQFYTPKFNSTQGRSMQGSAQQYISKTERK